METTKLPTRPSRLIELDKFEAIRVRMDLNTKLMSGSCAFSEPLTLTFNEAEIRVLQVMAMERFAVNTLLRKRAIHALGRQKSVEAIDEMMRLAQTEHEETGVRYEAVQAICAISPRIGRVVMEKILTVSSPDLSLSVVRYLNQSEEPDDKRLAEEFLSLKKNQRIRELWEQKSNPNSKQTAPIVDKTPINQQPK